ncbi:MAG: phosphoribosylamine--glycine ligase [Myxococcota bacterium]|nr:phosphoribosylamine--glycine ligase [Myxococcota bacterium]
MRVLVIGSGGREHALAWKIAQSPEVERVLSAPGSDAMAAVSEPLPELSVGDTEGLVACVQRESVDLVVVGPEDPLADGLSDALREAGASVFGPSRACAQLEASKQHARDFMARHGIPQPHFAAFEDLSAAKRHASELGSCVVKADGLAAGKGVTVCDDAAQAHAALEEAMAGRRFGDAGDRVLIEERMHGEEASYYALCDGERVVTLAPAQDHKRALDGDRGENTGGMGAYVPAPVVSEAVEKRVLEEIVHPTLSGLRGEGRPYVGVLYVGLMIDPAGAPRVVEFNVRFGDPETQPLMVQMQSDLVPLLAGAARGELPTGASPDVAGASVCVVLASEGYPRSYPKGLPIRGLEAAEEDPDVVVFHAGTRREADGYVTAGGRVLGVTARGDDIASARERAYRAADRITFEGKQLRRDIGMRALER